MNLAPNGKPSNLTPEQYRLVRTPAFKAWFGDWEKAYETENYDNVSKVIDEETKEPLVVYHGGKTKFNVFSEYSQGHYFTDNIKYAKSFAELSDDGHLFKCFINVRSYLDARKLSEINEKQLITFFKKNGFYSKEIKENIKDFFNKRHLSKTFWSYLRMYGVYMPFDEYDGIFLNEHSLNGTKINVYYVYKSTNIKLADGTNTTFDAKNPDIRYKIGGIFHGSPYYFDKFNTSKIGSGIGQQRDGWGIYLTDDKESAKNYGNYIYKTEIFKGKKLGEYTFY